MLNIDNVDTYYGTVKCLMGISLTVEKGEIVSLLGSNGAGKTTTIKTVLGLVRPKVGKILFENKEISKIKTPEIVKSGISVVPEGRRIFPKMTVKENLIMGAYFLNDREELKNRLNEVFKLFPRLEERTDQLAGTLSGGEQQMLAVGRALMGKPKLLMLDEPSLGLAPILVEEVFEVIQTIRESGVTILLVEQNAKKALEISDRGYVLQKGQIIFKGPSRELLNSKEIKEAYLS